MLKVGTWTTYESIRSKKGDRYLEYGVERNETVVGVGYVEDVENGFRQKNDVVTCIKIWEGIQLTWETKTWWKTLKKIRTTR